MAGVASSIGRRPGVAGPARVWQVGPTGTGLR